MHRNPAFSPLISYTNMKHFFLLFSLILSFAFSMQAQTKLPLIKAHSLDVDIRDAGYFRKKAWTISPNLRPDIYTTSSKFKEVTFYTDIDSITYRVTPDKDFNFIILVDNKDSAYTQIHYVKSFRDILIDAAAYNRTDKRPIPKFTYQSMDHPELQALRKGFNLDSIAGEGNEVSKIINLLHWVHNLIPHDGNHGNPEVKNAMNMIAECKNGKRGLNCRGLATVLNECYLSMGFKSRFITCMPKDSVFDDCHVINMVYSNDLHKWVWIDPTNDAYVMDENGVLLSVQEVRERVINGKTLIVNPDANWNHKASAVKEEYLYQYMAKNLYRIQCPLVSEYDTETWKNGKRVTYVELLPLDAYQQTPQLSEETNSKTGTTFVNYKTNNPDLFWTTPE